VQIALYSLLGSVCFLMAWAIPGLLIKPVPPRLLCQILAVITTAFFLPAPADEQAAFFAGQYAFAGGVVLIGAWELIRKARSKSSD
jgi:membrane associated rhomboid family serine protease